MAAEVDPYDNGLVHRALIGSIGGIALSVAAGLAMVPIRSHVSVATPALILVLPVIAAVIVGGLVAGSISVVAGFVVYDYLFLPPYNQLSVEHPEDLVALVVYAVVMAVLAQVISMLSAARADATRRSLEGHRLFEMSESLVEDKSLDELLRTIVKAVGSVFKLERVALLVPDGDRLQLVASFGTPFEPDELHQLDPGSGLPVSLATTAGLGDAISTVALIASGQPVGMLALKGMPTAEEDRELLHTFANHAALAIERTTLREQALRTEVLEEVERLRHVLVGAISHDLRTPLATLKVASSTLLDPPGPLSGADVAELYLLFDKETDRLTRLVESLLDMTRIDAGVLEVQRTSVSIRDLLNETVVALHAALGDREVRIEVGEPSPTVEIDQLLIFQVLTNLIENAHRHAPEGTAITLRAEFREDRVTVSVDDEGAGVPREEREAVFDRYMRFDTGGRAGLGLTIAKTFVEAHGERIWVEDGDDGGARFAFTLTQTPNGAVVT